MKDVVPNDFMEEQTRGTNSIEQTPKDSGQPDYTTCTICGKKFDTPAEASKHVTIEHMQKGEIPQ